MSWLDNLLQPPPAAMPRVEPRLGNMLSEGETISSSDVRVLNLFASGSSVAGAAVTEATSMRVSAVYACVRLIAGAIAGLPLPIYERTEEGKKRADHDYWWLLNERPCPTYSAAQFWEFVVWQVLLRADAVCYLVRNRAGRVTSIVPFKREQVQIELERSKDPREPSVLRYYFSVEGGYFGAEQEDVLHFTGFGFNGCHGMSVIQWGARNGIGIAIRGDEYAGKFFTTGGTPQFAIKTAGKMSPDQQEELKSSWVEKYGSHGGPNSTPLVLTQGLDVATLSMTAQDAQLLESRQWQVVDIARAFGVPPFMIAEMGKATYNNTENLGADFVKYTLSPHLNRWEQELNIKLFKAPRYYAEFNVDGLMRGDATARANYYKAALGGTQQPAWMVPNEVRALENLPPVAGGNDLAKPQPGTGKAPDSNNNPGDTGNGS